MLSQDASYSGLAKLALWEGLIYIGCIFHKTFTVVNGTPVHMCYCEKQHGIVHSGHHNNQLLHGILLVTLLD